MKHKAHIIYYTHVGDASDQTSFILTTSECQNISALCIKFTKYSLIKKNSNFLIDNSCIKTYFVSTNNAFRLITIFCTYGKKKEQLKKILTLLKVTKLHNLWSLNLHKKT